MYLFTLILYLDLLTYLPILYYECLENDQATLNQTDRWTKRIQSLLVQYTFLLGIFGTILFIIGHLRYSILFIIGHLRYSILYYRSSSVQYCLLLVIFGTVLFIIGHLLYSIVYYRASSVQYCLLSVMSGTATLLSVVFGTVYFIIGHVWYSKL